jgi:L-ascorbate metabolism protein UlaG (beta-lactamase superfamily)
MTTTTNTLEQQIRELAVAPGTVALVWLGQASFVLKSPRGTIVMIDPYLSDWGEQMWGLRRIIEPPVDPGRLQPNLLLISHWHEDHFDVPIIRQWAKAEQEIHLVAPPTCTVRAAVWGWPDDTLHPIHRGESFQLGDVTATAVFARHDTPEAVTIDEVGYLIDIGGVKVWYVGDTEYDARLRPLRAEQIDVALTPINGVGGNLNAQEAALLMTFVQPRIAIPMHYNMWAPEAFGPGATLDPQLFIDTHARLGGTAEIRVLEVGEIVTFSRDA